MKKICIFMISSVAALFAMQPVVVEKTSNSILLDFQIPAPALSKVQLLDEVLQIPRWPDAHLAFDSLSGELAPYFSIPILLPPDGSLPSISIVQSEQIPDNHVLADNISDTQFPSGFTPQRLTPQAQVNVIRSEPLGSFETGRLLIFPFDAPGRRLSSIKVRLTFDPAQGSFIGDDPLQGAYVNGHMAAGWKRSEPLVLAKSASYTSGTWYRIPINQVGIYRITTASLPGGFPDTDPESWQVYAPFYEGRSLPFALSNTEPTPANLKAVSVQGVGLEDAAFDSGDEIRFFAQALNGDFKGDNFTHLFGTQRYYWLCIPNDDTQIARQVASRTSAAGTADNTQTSYEKRVYHEAEIVNQLHSGQNWVGEKMTGDSDYYTFTFNDDYLNMSSEVRLNVRSIADYDIGYYSHNFTVELNGLPFAVSQNASAFYRTIDLSGSAGSNMLQEGNNVLRLHYTSNSGNSIVYLDSLRLSYERYLAPASNYLFGTLRPEGNLTNLVFRDLPQTFQVWDISDPGNIQSWVLEGEQFKLSGPAPREIIGFSDDQILDVVVETQPDLGAPVLRRPDMQADYIIITPVQFLEQAERVRQLREEQVPEAERLSVEIVKLEDLYREFSAGTSDPAAIKHFLHYVYFYWQQPRLRYVLLLGDTDYDYRNISGQSHMIIPTYQKDGVSDVGSYATDDKFTFIASGIWDELPDIAIGRYPAQTADQLKIMIDKLVSYVLEPEPGIWQNTLTLVADDPLRPSNSVELEHIRDSETLSRTLPSSAYVSKVYLTEYPEVKDPNSPYIKKPKAREDFLQKLYNGTLLVNYYGHGSPNVWAQEEVFTNSDLGLVKTGMKLPFWVAGTCDWAKYDDVNASCVPEELMLMERNGAIGVLSTTRKTYSYFNNILLSDFFDYLFPDGSSGRSISVGDAIMMAKNNPAGSDANNEKYILFSDPALRLASPVHEGQISQINPSTLQAMGQISYTGQTDTVLSPNARAAVTVYDTPTPVTRSFIINATGATGMISYTLPGKRIFRGLISVDQTDFSGQFTVPKDIKYSGTGGVLSVQYWDETGLNGSVYVDTLVFNGTDSTAIDNEGPEILFLSNDLIMLNGDHFSANELLEIEISDAQGINLTGAAGHGITLAIDGDWDNAFQLTELFEYDLDHSDQGRLRTYLSEIGPGEHVISVKAWDSQNNPGEESIRLVFFAASDFRIYDLFNFPNPMSSDTQISYILSHPASVEFGIYTLGGRKIMSQHLGFQPQGFNSFYWEGKDRFGNSLANGVYILVITADSELFQEPSQALQKIVIAR